jgi:hypothetical protein
MKKIEIIRKTGGVVRRVQNDSAGEVALLAAVRHNDLKNLLLKIG